MEKMEFLVEIEINLPPDCPEDERLRLLAAETVRARVLRKAGVIHRLWRIPGRTANVGIWVAPDATALHEQLTSLPLWGWMDVHVRPLALHPLESDEAVRGATG
ncbi:muconolactone Delta-isomerase family protein [Kribbella sp. NPDC051952]|uniref:muconolactone Delta-isomerase n=1 Tax=Kribbella sp. NPDC051952 TaxID=3154851 RepID=UPI00343469E7